MSGEKSDLQQMYEKIIEIIKALPAYQVCRGHEFIDDTYSDAVILQDLLKAMEDKL